MKNGTRPAVQAANAWHAADKVGLKGRYLPLVVSDRSLADAKGPMEDRLLTNLVVEFLADCMIEGVVFEERTRESVLSDLHQLACHHEGPDYVWILAADRLGKLGEPQPMERKMRQTEAALAAR